jgi:hypothetical protein
MNRKQLGILLLLLIVLGGAGFHFYRKQNASWSDGNPGLGKKLLEDFQVNDVSRIVISEGSNTVNLVKKEDIWRVSERGDYPANYSEISGFLLKARDLKIVQIEPVGPSQLSRLQLAAGQGTNSPVTVEFKGQGDKPLKTLLLGKKHLKKSNRPSQFGEGDGGWPDGRYVKVGGGSEVALISDPLDSIEVRPAQWLNKDFVRVEKAKSIEVVFPEATNSWKLTRDTEAGEWKLADAKPGEELDASKVSGISNPLSSPTFSDVLISVNAEHIGLSNSTVITIATFEDFVYAIKAGQKTNDDYPVAISVTAQFSKERAALADEKPEDKAKLDKEFSERRKKLEEKLGQEQAFGKWTYLIAGWTIDSLIKDRSQLMAEKTPIAGSITNAVENIQENLPPP